MEVGGVLASCAGDALLDAGESMKCLAEVKDSLDIEVKQNFIDPLQNLCDKDLKEIQVRCDGLSLPAPQDSPQGSLTQTVRPLPSWAWGGLPGGPSGRQLPV